MRSARGLSSVAILAPAACALMGCVSLNEGAVSYRRADPLTRPRDYPADAERNANRHGQHLFLAPLIRQNASLDDVGLDPDFIQPGEQFSIRLDYGYIDGNMNEIPFAPDRLEVLQSPFIQRGEIVVLANVFEFPAAESAAPPAADSAAAEAASQAARTGFSWDGAALEQAKVIYYSNDVHANQPLNFSNIPLFGPEVYHGRPVGIQLIVLELDNTSPQMEAMLSQLATIGKNAATTQGPLASALFSVGQSLISNANDDTLMRYALVLDPVGGNELRTRTFAEAPVLEAGRLVFFRREDRHNEVPWSDFYLDHNTGRLYYQNGDQTCSRESQTADTSDSEQADAEDAEASGEPDNTQVGAQTAAQDEPQQRSCMEPYDREIYFTLNIVNNGVTTNTSHYNYQSLAELRTAINVDPDPSRSQRLIAALAADASTYSLQQRHDALQDEWTTVANTYIRDVAPYVYRTPDCPEPSQDFAGQREVARFTAEAAAQRFWRRLKQFYADSAAQIGAAKPPNEDEAAEPDQTDARLRQSVEDMRAALVVSIGRFTVAPESGRGMTAEELQPDAFSTLFLDPSHPGEFLKRLSAATAASYGRAVCPAVTEPG